MIVIGIHQESGESLVVDSDSPRWGARAINGELVSLHFQEGDRQIGIMGPPLEIVNALSGGVHAIEALVMGEEVSGEHEQSG